MHPVLFKELPWLMIKSIPLTFFSLNHYFKASVSFPYDPSIYQMPEKNKGLFKETCALNIFVHLMALLWFCIAFGEQFKSAHSFSFYRGRALKFPNSLM